MVLVLPLKSMLFSNSTKASFFFFRELLKMFINPELIQWSSLVSVYEKILKNGTDQIAATDVFNPNTEDGQARWKELKNRVVEHVR